MTQKLWQVTYFIHAPTVQRPHNIGTWRQLVLAEDKAGALMVAASLVQPEVLAVMHEHVSPVVTFVSDNNDLNIKPRRVR